MSPSVRRIRYNELQDLFALYRQLHPDDPQVEQDKYLHALWLLVSSRAARHLQTGGHGFEN